MDINDPLTAGIGDLAEIDEPDIPEQLPVMDYPAFCGAFRLC